MLGVEEGVRKLHSHRFLWSRSAKSRRLDNLRVDPPVPRCLWYVYWSNISLQPLSLRGPNVYPEEWKKIIFCGAATLSNDSLIFLVVNISPGENSIIIEKTPFFSFNHFISL